MRLVPGPEFFLPEAVKRRRWERGVDSAAAEAPEVLHLTHAHCLDGAASDVVVRLASNDGGVRTVWLEPHESLDALERVAEVAGRGRRLVVSDLSMQKGEGARLVRFAGAAARGGWRVEWRDHHARQWDGAPFEDLAKAGRFLVDLEGEECGATLAAKDLGVEVPWVRRLLVAVRDHDLWLQQDPHGLVLQDACRAMRSEAFVRHLLRVKDSEEPGILAAAAEAAEARRRGATEGVAASRIVVGARGATVGVVYGDVPTNDVLHALYTEKGADVGVLLKPEGTFSLRSRKGVDVCHRVAQRFGGGGHPNASGGTLGIKGAAFPAYWLLRERHPRARALVAAALEEAAGARHADL